jgi:hypothetical protein
LFIVVDMKFYKYIFFCLLYLFNTQINSVTCSLVSLENSSSGVAKVVVKVELQKKERAVFEESVQVSNNDMWMRIEQQKILTASVLEYLPHVKRSEQVFNDSFYIELIVKARKENLQQHDTAALCISCIVLLYDYSATAQVRMVPIDKIFNVAIKKEENIAHFIVSSPDVVVPIKIVDKEYEQEVLIVESNAFIVSLIHFFQKANIFGVLSIFIILSIALFLLRRYKRLNGRLFYEVAASCLLAILLLVPLFIINKASMVVYCIVMLIFMLAYFGYAIWRESVDVSCHMAYAFISHVTLFMAMPLLLHGVCYLL